MIGSRVILYSHTQSVSITVAAVLWLDDMTDESYGVMPARTGS